MAKTLLASFFIGAFVAIIFAIFAPEAPRWIGLAVALLVPVTSFSPEPPTPQSPSTLQHTQHLRRPI
jgi:uncharacterized membrane protein YgaE (UPF0421/DUF939 family)